MCTSLTAFPLEILDRWGAQWEVEQEKAVARVGSVGDLFEWVVAVVSGIWVVSVEAEAGDREESPEVLSVAFA